MFFVLLFADSASKLPIAVHKMLPVQTPGKATEARMSMSRSHFNTPNLGIW
jgi:hypothetical protein